jgi:hypothetical protein
MSCTPDTDEEKAEWARLKVNATVCVVMGVKPHPNADKLDLLDVMLVGQGVNDRVTVVTGKHYRKEQLGIFIPAGLTIPGWMAEDMWLFGRATAMKNRFDVRVVTLRGIESPGLFYGHVYRKDGSDERSIQRFEKQKAEGGEKPDHLPEGWMRAAFWRKWWQLGDDVTAYLGLTKASALSQLA